MGIRQAVNEHPGVSTWGTIAVILVMAGVIVWEVFAGPHAGSGRASRAFYSDDDGQTWFADAGNKLTPFTDANNKQAVYACVFRCGTGKPFVAYLMRATEETRQAALKAGRSPDDVPINPMYSEVKKPGDKAWLRFDQKNPRPFLAITNPTCPQGGKLAPVLPGS